VQTLPAVFLGLYTNRFHRLALIIGWAGGMIVGTGMVAAQNFESSVYPLVLGGITIPIYAAVVGIAINLILTLALTPFFRAIGVPAGQDATTPADYEARPVLGLQEPAGKVERPLPVFQPPNLDARQPIPSFQQPMPGLASSFQRPAPGSRTRNFQQADPITEQSVLEQRVGQYYKKQ
jgi:hypothetical protein